MNPDLHTISIRNCTTVPHEEKRVHAGQLVKFRSIDSRSYQVIDLGELFEDAPDPILVPQKGFSGYYLVVGQPKRYEYHIIGEPPCMRPHGPPEIIIVD